MDISALTTATTSATALSNLILVTPQSQAGYQPQSLDPDIAPPPALLFHYEGEQSLMLESDITDHYVEDNTAIQDQITLKPETYTTHGFIGELNNVVPKALAPIKFIANKLYTVSAFTPELSVTALNAYNQAQFLYQTAQSVKNTAVNAWASVQGASGEAQVQSLQQKYFQQFYAYQKNRTLFTIQTPWCIMKDMAIKSLRAIQDAETDKITDFEIQFKMIRFASTVTQLQVEKGYQGRAAQQSSGVVDLGTSTPANDISLASRLA